MLDFVRTSGSKCFVGKNENVRVSKSMGEKRKILQEVVDLSYSNSKTKQTELMKRNAKQRKQARKQTKLINQTCNNANTTKVDLLSP